MLGIYFSSVSDSSQIQKKNMKFESVTYSANGHSVCLIYPKFRENIAFYSNGNDWVLIDGCLFDESNELSAKDIYSRLNLAESVHFEDLNGEFLISYFIDGKLNFVNDRMGQRQYCIVEKGDVLSIAPTPGHALRLANIPKVINKKALYFFINSKKLRLEQDTIWQDCRVIKPATFLSWSDTGILINQYWKLSYSPESDNVKIDELVLIYREAVNKRVKNQLDKALTLTGGLDSRTMLCAIEQENLSKVEAVTSGMYGCTEIQYASEVAETVGVAHNPYYLKPEDIFTEDALSYFEDEDIDLLIQAQWYPFLDSIGSKDILLHGLDLDVTIGGIYLTDSVCKINGSEELKRYIHNESFINLRDTELLFSKDKVDIYHHVVDDAVARILQECPQENIQEKYDYFILMHSMNRVILQRYRAIRNKIETVSPMYDIDLMDYYLKVPLKERTNYKLFHPFMKKICGPSSKIKYQRTNLPADVPVHYWSESQKIEKEREELYREISRTTNGKSYVHYNGYYTNVDEWLRFNSTWIHAIKELLQSDRSIIVKEWLNKDYVEKMINEHLNHEKSHMSTLVRLMSAELFLRLEQGSSTQIISSQLSVE